MKKSFLLAVGLLISAAVVYAGNQYNWGTSTGANWITPDNTAIVPGQPLIITSTMTYPAVTTSTTAPIGMGIQTIAQINALVPPFKGQFIFCSDCSITPVCVSTGTSIKSYAAIASTSSVFTANTVMPCQ